MKTKIKSYVKINKWDEFSEQTYLFLREEIYLTRSIDACDLLSRLEEIDLLIARYQKLIKVQARRRMVRRCNELIINFIDDVTMFRLKC